MDRNDQNYYEVLGVSSQARDSEIRAAFRDLVKEHHPDRFTDPAKKAEAEAFLKRLTEAFNTIGRKAQRDAYDRSMASSAPAQTAQRSPQEMSREYLQQGRARLKSGDLAGALSVFDHLLRQDPDNSQALFHAGMIRLKNPRWRALGSQQVERAIELDPFSAGFVVEYARFLMENGQSIRALRLLEASQKNYPADDNIKALLAQLSGDKSWGLPLLGKKK